MAGENRPPLLCHYCTTIAVRAAQAVQEVAEGAICRGPSTRQLISQAKGPPC
jgi:hypothetical protein